MHVIPAQAGIHSSAPGSAEKWIPASAGMTVLARLGVLQKSDDLPARHRQETSEEFVNRLAGFQIIQQGLDWDSGPAEDGRAAHHVRAATDDSRFHGLKLRRLRRMCNGRETRYSTVTLFARLRGWSTSVPLSTATW